MAASTRNPYYGKMASNQRIGERVEQIVHFDQRFQVAERLGSVERMRELAKWADEKGLGLARKAHRAAAEMSQRGAYG